MQACVRGSFLCLLPCVDRSGGPEEEKHEGSHLFYNYCHLLEKGKCIIDRSNPSISAILSIEEGASESDTKLVVVQ